MDLKNLFQSKGFKTALWILGGLIIALLIFQAGMLVGFKKADFSHHWGENYYRVFDGPPRRGTVNRFLPRDNFLNAHGEMGKIIKINLPEFVLEDRDSAEKIILVTDKTDIKRWRDTLKPADLKMDDFVTVIGSPDDQARIEAKFIRVLPPPPDFSATTSAPVATNTKPQ